MLDHRLVRDGGRRDPVEIAQARLELAPGRRRRAAPSAVMSHSDAASLVRLRAASRLASPSGTRASDGPPRALHDAVEIDGGVAWPSGESPPGECPSPQRGGAMRRRDLGGRLDDSVTARRAAARGARAIARACARAGAPAPRAVARADRVDDRRRRRRCRSTAATRSGRAISAIGTRARRASRRRTATAPGSARMSCSPRSRFDSCTSSAASVPGADDLAVLQQDRHQRQRPVAQHRRGLQQPQRVPGRRGVGDDDVVARLCLR